MTRLPLVMMRKATDLDALVRTLYPAAIGDDEEGDGEGVVLRAVANLAPDAVNGGEPDPLPGLA